MRNLVPAMPEPVPCPRVLVVGAGAAGVVTATHLLRRATETRPVDVRLVEQGALFGPGLAYSTDHPLHTLNNFAGRLSAVHGDPGHLLRWCSSRDVAATPTSFLTRQSYGRYLADVLDETPVPSGSALHRTMGTAIDIVEHDGTATVALEDGRTYTADSVVLALGNPPPRRQAAYERLGHGYVADPWAADLLQRVQRADEILLLGTGLTAVDVAVTIHDALPDVRLTAVSRHGLLPAAHRVRTARLHDVFDPGRASLDTLLVRVRERVAEVEEVGGDWRDVVDSLRSCANKLWQGFSASEQDRFVHHVARRWEIARHRMAPETAARVAELREAGVLRVARVDEVDTSAFRFAVNCTGPTPVPSRGWNPLVDALLDRGTVRPHRLGLGVDLDAEGRPLGVEGRASRVLTVVGAARRGLEWEVAAVPDLRAQAADLADRLVSAGETPRAAGWA
jgi:uncharacterized NAD(P)/FAD-binding protein YdhS